MPVGATGGLSARALLDKNTGSKLPYVFSGVAWVSGAAGRGAAYPWGPLPGVYTGKESRKNKVNG